MTRYFFAGAAGAAGAAPAVFFSGQYQFAAKS
jgi:hypothetical protein